MLLSAVRHPLPVLSLALAVVLAACTSGSAATPLPSGAEPPADCARIDADGVITLSADDLEFSAPCMVAVAGEAFTITFTNEESVGHDVALYQDSTRANEIMRGEVITGPATSIDYPVEALAAGAYFFDCIVHPSDMNGTLYVVEADAVQESAPES
jgi:plastocyanin